MVLSGRGRTFIAVGVVSVLTGLVLGVVDLERVGVFMLALPAAAWLAVRQARSGLGVAHLADPDTVEVGEPVEVRVALTNPNGFGTGPLRVSEEVPGAAPLRFSVAGVRARQRRTIAYPLPALGRGRYSIGPTSITASDPFGLVLASSVSADVAGLTVRPQRQPLPRLTLPMAWRDGGSHASHSVGSGGSDDASVREYRHGDDLRKIHWRSTARSGAFMVRQEERPWHGRTIVLLDTRTNAYPYDHPGVGKIAQPETSPFEWAVSAAASIAVHLIERGRRVSVVTGSGATAHEDAPQLLDLLADTKPAMRSDLEPLARALTGSGRDSTMFAIIAAYDTRQLRELTAHPRIPGSAVALLISPETFELEVGPASADVAGRPVAAAENGPDWRDAADLLRAAGWRVVGVRGGDQLADLWPALLSQTMGALR